jgi:hypothetical protein
MSMLNLLEEYAESIQAQMERIMPYSPNTPRDIKIEPISASFYQNPEPFRSYIFYIDRIELAKNPLTLLSL